MTSDQFIILALLGAMLGLFLWGRWRHDIVALGALLACVFAGLVPPAEAFDGFSHPAVITVACVLVLSRGLQSSGAIDIAARAVLPREAGPTRAIAALVALGAALSGVMNNVGAMALLMPVGVQLARQLHLAPGQVLMPLSFGTILGGMTTLIGTPPNLIVGGFRAELSRAEGFAMFDFTPVGLAVAAAGVAFVTLLGWRLVPRRSAETERFAISAYLVEARVPEGSRAADLRLREIEAEFGEIDAQVVGLVRHEVRVTAPHGAQRVRAGDILVLEADAEALPELLSALGLELAKEEDEAEPAPPADAGGAGQEAERRAAAEDPALLEMVVTAGSPLIGRSVRGMGLRTRYGVNLLAVSRQGRRPRARLRALHFAAGDLLLMQGSRQVLAAFAAENGVVPLAERGLSLPDPRKALIATLILAGAVGGAAFGIVPAAVSFAAGVVASMVLGTVPPRRVYQAIDWPVIVLLGALLPVASAMEATGTADRIARALLEGIAGGRPVLALGLLIVVTMFLSDVMNNAATAAVMCPIAISAAAALGVSADSFLMAVAIGASCAFLTPIGHQNNTLILGPGGFRFGDYWRLGLPLEMLILAVAVPALLVVWPL